MQIYDVIVLGTGINDCRIDEDVSEVLDINNCIYTLK